MLYELGKSFGLMAIGWITGLAFLEIWVTKGPIYTALHNRQAGCVFLIIFLLAMTGVYAYLIDLYNLLV